MQTEVQNQKLVVPSSHIAVGRHKEILAKVTEESINLSVWQRNEVEFLDSITEIMESDFCSTKFSYHYKQDLHLVGAILDEDLNLKSNSAFLFYQDIMNLVLHMQNICNAKELGIMLEVLCTDNCKYFHTDKLHYRLIQTYFGPGSIYLNNENVNRSGLSQQDNSKVIIRENEELRIPIFSPAIMKGEKAAKNFALVHRSPAIAAHNFERLVLRIDLIE